jgi:hypothetical protein
MVDFLAALVRIAVDVRAAEIALFDAEARLDEALKKADWDVGESQTACNLMGAYSTLGAW